ncbi:DEAD/DEAH box helicase, partial [bacterium]|nr:DEAD/DEAH box helicase [bacterium]
MRIDGFDFELDDFQAEALEYISNGKSVVVCAPTGAGKTCIAEFAIQKALKNSERIFYTTPLKALSNQKFRDFGKKYGENNVGLLTGDTSINRDAPIVVMTTEVFRNMLYGTTFGSVKDNIKNVKYVVLDEVHYMNDEQRGTVWEESIIYCPTDIQIIALSATVANSQELVDWINTVHTNTEHVYTNFRPVPLRFFYYDSSQMGFIAPLMTPEGRINKKLRPQKNTKDFRRKLPQKSIVKDVVATLHKKSMLPAIYFTFSRKKCNEQMEKCAGLSLLTPQERQEIRILVDEYLIENPYLANNEHLEYILNGVAAHHAGLLPSWKVLVEKLFQKGLIKVVFATETLAAGINMPARTCVISAISKRTDSGHRKLTANEFLQMSGRAGRRGMDDVGYVVITSTPFETPEDVYELAISDSDNLESRFSPSYSMVTNLLQRFSLDEAKELVLKSFGYYSSTERLTPFYLELDEATQKIEEIKTFKCFKGAKIEDILEFNKRKNIYVEFRNIYKTLKKQAHQTKRKNAPEVEEYEQKVKDLYRSMSAIPCNDCKLYKKHIRDLELLERFQKRAKQLNNKIEYEKDVYWKQFLAHKKVLQNYGY